MAGTLQAYNFGPNVIFCFLVAPITGSLLPPPNSKSQNFEETLDFSKIVLNCVWRLHPHSRCGGQELSNVCGIMILKTSKFPLCKNTGNIEVRSQCHILLLGNTEERIPYAPLMRKVKILNFFFFFLRSL